MAVAILVFVATSEQEVTTSGMRRGDVETPSVVITCQSPVAPPLKRPLLYGLTLKDHEV